MFQPAAIALILADALALALLLPAGAFAVQVLRRWDLASGSAVQVRLERRTYLIATLLGLVLAGQILSLLLFVFTADRLAERFVGAMCAVGTLNVNPWGFPALYLRLGLFFLAAAWLVMNHLDNRARDYPLIRPKYTLLLLILPLAMAAAAAQLAFFAGLRPDVITSCCGSLFGSDGDGVSADLAALPPLPAMAAFYGVLGLTVAAGLHYLRRRRGLLLFSGLGVLAFPVTIAAAIAFVSLYVYEHPHHHCPFCLLKPDYGYLGYALYLPLFGGCGLALGLGVSAPFARRPGLAPVLAETAPRLVGAATALLALLMVLVLVISAGSNLILLNG